MAVTLRDVARAAGVSAATASRALSAPDLVSPERRELVRRVARELGYRPNRAARELITGRSGHLCLVVPDLENPFFSAVAKAVQARARAAGHAVVVADAEEDPRLEAELVAQLGAQADGVLLCSPRMSSDDLAAVAADGRPVLLVNREGADLPSVVVDNRDGLRQAVRHLHALGHRRIAYAGGPAGSWSDARRRDGLAALDLDLEVLDLGAHAPVFAGGVGAADLAVASGATAVLTYNDLMALGVLDRLRTRGVRVPQDVSVVGFDDAPVATLVTPSLTTVAVPLARLGRTAVDLLLTPHDDDAPHTVLPVELVVRGTTAPPPRPPETR
ncbi:LacI family DNA-binding transcriptional regulator [Cellulomonas sp. zg-ZUI222]|uniref:LacI family DNA-binding transcriptional regulator n=1 Tax=Cellulomonas wangleii TaxID=2816956 RepID=A0ABX8D2U2_9CELL|nr:MULTISPECIES: LacI family DNA-binding transcriptional regulator [Cellulomonas]MBO0899272.1 LacI family DNA-binding transcriptional regulator [Cellulomonas sp. zg-ZUI22]MBO0920123.1 LacI family DNA-binding transcriptional regulator [Cellulomonas wangleii]MBO0923448.1 LacI family DNA-binding transcriptional regulator [Cellulomonas wangleii]QVI61794.1 LacI family DNA-binding transcriptional regulator [Cellulomonas wangleii]